MTPARSWTSGAAIATIGLPPSSLLVAQVAVMAAPAAVGAAVMLVLAYAGFDLAAPESVAGVVVGFAVGVVAFAALGVFLGSVMPTPGAA